MACDLTGGRDLVCKDSVGGIDKIYFVNFLDGLPATITWSDTGSYIAGDSIASLTGTPTAYEYQIKDSASFTQNIQSDRAAGTTVYEQVIELTLHKLTAADHKEIKMMAAGRPHAIILDKMGNYQLAGLEHGLDVTGGTIATGTSLSDMYGYTLTLTGMERAPAPFVVDGISSFTVP